MLRETREDVRYFLPREFLGSPGAGLEECPVPISNPCRGST